MQFKAISFITNLIPDTRRRHAHTRINNEVVGFVIQLEVFTGDNWMPVVRYDTAHGFAHKHIFHYHGKSEQVPLYTRNYGEALDFADIDIKTNWELYREKYLKEAEND